ncbi:hypothetical protein QBC44DRAFT_375914 [Cladorrhinum sp. PSN332]|nr:hypothetical protein QBC44DRAFT_375914 [Cladorrhinum sp. PSN332]
MGDSQVARGGLLSNARTIDNGKKIVIVFTSKPAIRTVMKEFYTNAKPSIDIKAYNGRINPAKVKTRPSYLNALLIQSHGITGQTYEKCANNPTRGPFTECRRTKGHFNGYYRNCKWYDHTARYSVRLLGEEEDRIREVIVGTSRVIKDKDEDKDKDKDEDKDKDKEEEDKE